MFTGKVFQSVLEVRVFSISLTIFICTLFGLCLLDFGKKVSNIQLFILAIGWYSYLTCWYIR